MALKTWRLAAVAAIFALIATVAIYDPAKNLWSDAKPKGVVDLGEKDDKTKAFEAQNNFYYIPGKTFIVPHEFNPLKTEKGFNEDGKFSRVYSCVMSEATLVRA